MWANDRKTAIVAHYENESGTRSEARLELQDPNNPSADWKEVLEVVGEEGLERGKQEFLQGRERQQRIDRRKEKERLERERSDLLFKTKLETFEIDEVRNSKDRKLKARIRKAKSVSEVQIFAAVLIANEMRKEMEEPVTPAVEANTTDESTATE